MEKLNYRQAFNLITEAYIKGEIKPWNASFCFCGTLCRSSGWLVGSEYFSHSGYSASELERMEDALLNAISRGKKGSRNQRYKTETVEFENQLFAGMCAAIEVLKQIHIERNDPTVEEYPFIKRLNVMV